MHAAGMLSITSSGGGNQNQNPITRDMLSYLILFYFVLPLTFRLFTGDIDRRIEFQSRILIYPLISI